MQSHLLLLTLFLAFLSVNSSRGQLIGLASTPGQAAFQIVSVDPATGASGVLNPNTGVAYDNNIFISNPSAGVIYGVGTNGQIYTYNSNTGANLNTAQTNLSIAALAIGLNGNLIGLAPTSSQSAFQIVSINPITGASVVLNPNTGVAYASNIFISNPSAGVAYAVGTNGQIYTYNLTTGSNFNTAQTNLSISALALGLNGNLIGLAPTSSQSAFQIVSINPITGASVVLNPNTGVAYASNIFISNPSADVAYAVGTNGQIYTYNLTTGSNFNTAQTNLSIGALALNAVPEPNTLVLLFFALGSALMFKSRKCTK